MLGKIADDIIEDHDMPQLQAKRIVCKISGEAIGGSTGAVFDPEMCRHVVSFVLSLHDIQKEVVLVIGGGNIFRGKEWASSGVERSYADHGGMLATMVNGHVLRHFFQDAGMGVVVLGAFPCRGMVEEYTRERALFHLQRGEVVICVGGTGNPFFTTDTAAALRACELGADLLMKGTKVDGVYDKDPLAHDNAIRYDMLSYSQVLSEKLQVMDLTAITMCMENSIPIFVFNVFSKDKLVLSPEHGTVVRGE